MKRILFALTLVFATIALAQPQINQITITVNVNGASKSWTFDLPTGLTDFQCDKKALLLGTSSTCTITLDTPAAAASGGIPIVYTCAKANGPCPPGTITPAVLTVQPGQSSLTFTVTRQ